ncbi:hypothetical protein [Clostridium psychrophilum]|uniref:hypothetical protein n=1 Tax=Clostridium psychrophilum TaxID=132926 RepID=UPI001C0BCF9D|nr:hypothetical protein [Clostridium psychrophilum]MBU3181986.1 hypothetical protein [Clostridium psychrophilum]
MSKNITEISNIAATWWSNVVINPKFDNGDDYKTEFLGNMNQYLGVKEITDEIKFKFLEHLSETIESKLKLKPHTINIEVDYSPDKILWKSAEYAQLPLSNFPIKTTMWVSLNHVAVSYGYSSNIEYLYTNKKYWNKKINSVKKSIKEYSRGIVYYDWLTEKAIKDNIAIMKDEIKEYQINLDKSEE